MQLPFHKNKTEIKDFLSSFFLLKGPAADATDAPQPRRLIVQPCDEDEGFFLFFHFNGAPVEWNCQGKNLSQCHFVHHKSHVDRTRASAVRDRRLTAWAMARPSILLEKKDRNAYNYAAQSGNR
jgi:hypothetical protein